MRGFQGQATLQVAIRQLSTFDDAVEAALNYKAATAFVADEPAAERAFLPTDTTSAEEARDLWK